MLNHALRKFFFSKCELAGIGETTLKKLVGHKSGLSQKYFKPLSSEELEQYKKAIPSLTISEEQQLSGKVKTLQTDKISYKFN
jgi:hypothetical protein